MRTLIEPGLANDFLGDHAELLISSFHRLTGRDLVEPRLSGKETYRALFEVPWAVVSHGTEEDPVFNYANKAALQLFEMSWAEFTDLESRKSAEAPLREERERLLQRVTQDGFVDDYRGVRISASGRRFMIDEATVWNLIDGQGVYRGQAAVLYNWSAL